jgi:class 3 adenylate cyclase
VLRARAQVLREEGRCEEAITEYEMVLSLDRNFVFAMPALAWCKFLTGSMDDEVIPFSSDPFASAPAIPQSTIRITSLGWCTCCSRVLMRRSSGSKGRATRIWYIRSSAPASPLPYGLKGETERAAAELAEAPRLGPDDRFSSIARFKAVGYFGVPKVRALLRNHPSPRPSAGWDARRMTANRRLTAILAADVAGYSRLMGADEEGTHHRLRAHFAELVEPKIKEHKGRTIKNTGDGLLAEFASVVDAVRCAVEVQRGMIDREPEVPEERRIRFRIGVNLGDVIAEDNDIFGDGVNVAARLEALAEPGGICISRTVRDHIRDKLAFAFEDLGEQSVKTSRGRCGSIRCAPKPSPSCRHQTCFPLRQSPSLQSHRACPSSCCPSLISATTPSRSISLTGSPRI